MLQAVKTSTKLVDEQINFLQGCQNGLVERKLEVYVSVVGSGVHTNIHPMAKTLLDQSWLQDFAMSKAPFRVSLVGLDGGRKKVWAAPVTCDELFSLIDAMPLRAQELRYEVKK